MTRGTTSVYRLRGLIGYKHIRSAVSGTPGFPTTLSGFGAQLRTVIGVLLLRCLAPTGSSLL